MKKKLQAVLQERVDSCFSSRTVSEDDKVKRKKLLLHNRQAELLRIQAAGKVYEKKEIGERTFIRYQVHVQYFFQQGQEFFIEEEAEEREAIFLNGKLISDAELEAVPNEESIPDTYLSPVRLKYEYDRMKAVQYAERWWNDFNPAYHKFEDDCTNFISQSLHAGGIPMWGSPNRSKGWWMSGESWSYSWTTAHGLYRLLASNSGIRTQEVQSAGELMLGDIICIDFEGDGRFDHSLIVTAKDANGMPLVNAHTTNSRHRYWTYEDSSRYSENIVYRFFRILDGS
ncbi:amidase domain-containing protein [Bacillus massiliglaciei]|uniref:amidase domain-containing protein n=1 Tax=Bacillus massiliglaciei TaxID=1816693 RepID=UPI000B10915F|nr:amidase domain-containing protein [Bacillus massiliglaciei]